MNYCAILLHLCFCFFLQSFYYPLHAGFPLGADDSPKNFLLEMHYDNPSNVPGKELILV